MIPRALRGLRGRLLIAFVLTSSVTLAVAAAITLSPLQERLRNESASTLQESTEDMRVEFNNELQKTAKPTPAGPEYALKEQERREKRFSDLSTPAFDLRERTGGARVLVADTAFTDRTGQAPAFLYDTDVGSQASALALAYRALRENSSEVQFKDDELQFAMPLYDADQQQAGVVVVQRSLTEVSTAVKLVRNALFTAAAIGLAVAIGLGLALSSTLTRRLGRLRRSALRITAEGPGAPAPTDRGRDEVGDLARALGRMQEELRRQEAARRAFVSTASHELRTPLTMLQGTMELLDEDLRDGADLADAQEQVESARRELRRLSVLASELLDLSRLDADVQLRSEPVEMGEIARAVAAEFELRAERRETPIEVALPAHPCWGRGDPDAIARVARILLDNALRYGPPATPVQVAAHADHGQAVITVTDAGPGIPAEERESIFERFHRGSGAGSAGGFGLGLAIGRELARRMGGELAFDDVPAAGTRFALTLRSTSSPAEDPRGRDRVSA
jgi:signal transduction histidine kinase